MLFIWCVWVNDFESLFFLFPLLPRPVAFCVPFSHLLFPRSATCCLHGGVQVHHISCHLWRWVCNNRPLVSRVLIPISDSLCDYYSKLSLWCKSFSSRTCIALSSLHQCSSFHSRIWLNYFPHHINWSLLIWSVEISDLRWH